MNDAVEQLKKSIRYSRWACVILGAMIGNLIARELWWEVIAPGAAALAFFWAMDKSYRSLRIIEEMSNKP